ASVIFTQNTGIIVSVVTSETNIYHGHPLGEVLVHIRVLTVKTPETAAVDRGAIRDNRPR
ncbi:unnamed protein product, partial [Scytosiphon promiscuus]